MSSIIVSVVIPVLNSSESLGRCLEALARQKTNRAFEVVVIDDGSTVDLTPVQLTFEKTLALKWLRFERNRGPASARNAGINAARGDIILFTDADCRPDEYWLENLSTPFMNPEVSGAKGVYRTDQHDLWARLAQIEFEERYERLALARDIDFIDTYCGAFRRSDLLKVGGFDETFPKADNEDVDLSFRMKELGGRFVFVPQAVVWHRHREGMANYVQLKFGRGYWRMRVYRKHPAKAGRDSYTPWTMKSQMLLMSLAPLGLLTPKNRRRWLGAWFVTCFPMARIAFYKDVALIPWLPVFALARTMAIIFGMLREMRDFHSNHFRAA